VWVATFGPAGLAPVAPGTFGSAAAILLYLPFSALGPFLYLLSVTALTALGIWAADEAERAFGQKDDGRIVIDEVVGQLLTWSPLVILAPQLRLSFFWLVTGFVAFRVLDIWKPGPVRWAERHFGGGAGVVLDDAVAGLIGGVALGGALGLAGSFGWGGQGA
jgi:phosphatidylglycerophosphatase A